MASVGRRKDNGPALSTENVMPTRSKFLSVLALTVAAGMLAACNTNAPAVRSLDGIAHSRERIDPTQSVLMSLHSLSVDPGTTLLLPTDNRYATGAAIIEHTEGPTSYLRIETFEAKATQQNMKDIRTALDDLTRSIGTELRQRIAAREALAAGAVARKAAEDAEAKKNAAVAEKQAVEKELGDVKQRLGDVQKNMIETINKRSTPTETFAPQFNQITAVEKQLIEQSTELQMKIAEKDLGVQSASKSLAQATKKVEAAETAAKESETAADKEDDAFKKKQEKLLDALSQPNIIVFRWNDVVRDQQVGGIAGAFQKFFVGQADVKRDSTQELTGYGVMNGFRRIRLVVGQDIIKGHCDWKQLAGIAGLRGSDGVVVTSVIQTREIMYLSGEDLDKTITAKLEALAGKNLSTDETSAVLTGSGISNTDTIRVQLQAKLDSLRSLQNNAYLSSPRRVVLPIKWSELRKDPGSFLDVDQVNCKTVSVTPHGFTGWITVHAVTTKLDEIMAQRGDRPTAGYSN